MIMLKIGCKFRTSGGYFKAKFANFAETLLFGTLSRLYLNTTLRPLMHLAACEKAFGDVCFGRLSNKQTTITLAGIKPHAVPTPECDLYTN